MEVINVYLMYFKKDTIIEKQWNKSYMNPPSITSSVPLDSFQNYVTAYYVYILYLCTYI